jgi:translation initiation factor 1
MKTFSPGSVAVYSTDKGKLCPACAEKLSQCRCRQENIPDTDGIVRLQRQVKGRNGKPVVLITGLPLAAADLKVLAKKLKSICGVGGSIDAGTIIIQGDKRDRLRLELESMGYRVKLSGG